MSSTVTTTQETGQASPSLQAQAPQRLNLTGSVGGAGAGQGGGAGGATRATADAAAGDQKDTNDQQKRPPTADKTFDFSGSSSDAQQQAKDPQTLRKARKESLVVAFRVFAKLGLGVGVVGHLTVRDSVREGCFWVNPFHTAFSCITVSDLLLVDHDGNVVEGGEGVDAMGVPRRKVYNQAAFAIHAAIHRARPDVTAACHSHSTYGSAFATFGRLPEMITQDSLTFYNDVALYDSFGGVVLADEESRKITEHLGNKKAIILQNHGLLTVGGSVESAAFWFVALEKVCQQQMLVDASRSRAEGREPVIIGDEEAKFTYEATGSEAAGRFAWQPYRQEIERETKGDYKA